MKALEIETAPVCFKSILACTVGKKINGHFVASITGYVSEEEEKKAMDNDNKPVSIFVSLENGASALMFQGMKTDVEVQYKGDTRQLTVNAISYTWLLDDKTWIRTFQGCRQTYRNIVDEVMKHRKKTGIIFDGKIDEKPGRIVVQYEESDWGFLNRIAGGLGMPLVADCNNTFPCFYFGMPKRKPVGDLDYETMKTLRFGDADGSVRQKKILRSRDYQEICDVVVIAGEEWRIHSVEMTLEKGELVFQYGLESERHKRKPTEGYNKKIQGASILGTVQNVKDARIQVRLESDLDQDWGNGIWYEYASIYTAPDGTGWYCMPEPGEQVRLYFPDMSEAHAYIISGTHQSGEGYRLDPDKKSFRTKYGKEIRFTPEEILLTNNQGISISLHDREGIAITSNSGISLRSGAGVDIQSNGQVCIHGEDGVSMQQNRNMVLVRNGIYEMGRNIEHI